MSFPNLNPTGANMKPIENEYGIAFPKKYDQGFDVHNKTIHVGPAGMAYDLVHSWGRINLVPEPGGGNNSTWVLMPIEELITRAFDAACAFQAECEKRGMSLNLDFPKPPAE